MHSPSRWDSPLKTPESILGVEHVRGKRIGTARSTRVFETRCVRLSVGLTYTRLTYDCALNQRWNPRRLTRALCEEPHLLCPFVCHRPPVLSPFFLDYSGDCIYQNNPADLRMSRFTGKSTGARDLWDYAREGVEGTFFWGKILKSTNSRVSESSNIADVKFVSNESEWLKKMCGKNKERRFTHD